MYEYLWSCHKIFITFLIPRFLMGIFFRHLWTESIKLKSNWNLQLSLIIRGRQVLSFWIANLEFVDKKVIIDRKIVLLTILANVCKIKSPRTTRVACTRLHTINQGGIFQIIYMWPNFQLLTRNLMTCPFLAFWILKNP